MIIEKSSIACSMDHESCIGPQQNSMYNYRARFLDKQKYKQIHICPLLDAVRTLQGLSANKKHFRIQQAEKERERECERARTRQREKE